MSFALSRIALSSFGMWARRCRRIHRMKMACFEVALVGTTRNEENNWNLQLHCPEQRRSFVVTMRLKVIEHKIAIRKQQSTRPNHEQNPSPRRHEEGCVHPDRRWQAPEL